MNLWEKNFSEKSAHHKTRLILMLVHLLIPIMLCVVIPLQTAYADTNVSGIIDSDTTWLMAQSPYIVTGSLLVNEAVTLTIEEGVTVKFDSGKSLQINGGLIAIGTAENAITFTSNAVDPAPGDWGCICFGDTSIDAI
ncbi:MAG: hypothetical protein ACMUIP_05380 [bacterium]